MSPRFVKISSPDPVVTYVADNLRQHLAAGERVLWLISGGSVINVAAAIACKLTKIGVPLERLTVSLTDERPGPVGHANSNWQQLLDAGFSLPGARLVPVLTGADSPTDTVTFARFLAAELERNQSKIGLFGVGPDGHTAGLPAQNAEPSDRPAAYYQAGDFQRLSMTPASIARLDEAVVYIMGEPKHPQIDRFATSLPYSEQSAQALKNAAAVTVFNDYKGELK